MEGQRRGSREYTWGKEGLGEVLERELHWVLHLQGFYLEVSGEDLHSMFISFPGVPPQGPGLHDCLVPGQGSLIPAAGPRVCCGVP